MTNKLFDNFIRDKIQHHTAEVPADMWDRIMTEKTSNKKGFIWWQALGVMALMIGMALIFGLFDTKDKNKIAEAKSPVEKANHSGDIIKANEPATSVATNKNEDATNANTGNLTSLINNQTASNENSNAETIADHSFGKVATTGGLQENFKERNFGNFQRLIKLNQGNYNLNNDVVKFEPSTDEKFDRLPITTIIHNAQLQTTANEMVLRNMKALKFSSVDCPSDIRGNNNGVYVEFFGSPDIAFKQMTYKNTRNNNYSNRTDSTASKQFSYTVGMRLSKDIGDKMVFKTGVQYSQINEKFDYRNENERYITTVVTIRTITNPNGSTTTVRDTSLVEQIGYRVKTTYNHYRSWDVPVILGYELAGNGWKAALNGGVIFNLSSTQEGEFLDTSNAPVSFAKTGSPIFKKKAGVSLYGGLDFTKNIGERTALFAEPYFRYNLSDRTTDASPFTSKFHTAGVLLGIRFKMCRSHAAK